MSLEDLPRPEPLRSQGVSKNVSLSPWVNDRCPAWTELLSSRHVARLTRRPRWVLLGLALLGRFPRAQRFCGHRIGWLRSEITDWMAETERGGVCGSKRSMLSQPMPEGQVTLPLKRAMCVSRKHAETRCSRRRIHRGVRG
jgi:predicted DNA-binding transcriptional regulator AlpA